MNSLEATLHFGMTRSDPPTAGQIRDQFFAVIIAGDNQGAGYYQDLAMVLMRAYVLAWEHAHEDAGEDEPPELECLECREAEQAFQAAYKAAYCPDLDETPDGMGWFDFVPYRETEVYPKQLMIDAGHLLGFKEKAEERQFAAFMQTEEGKKCMRDRGCPVD